MSEQTAFFNDGGVGHGGFIATFFTAGLIILDPFTPDRPSMTIEMPNQIGAPNKQASVSKYDTATATAQLNCDSTGNNPEFILRGDYFTAPANFGGETWYVDRISTPQRSGDFWKSELGLRKVYNP